MDGRYKERDKIPILCLGGGVESLAIVNELISLNYFPIVCDGNPKCAVARRIKKKNIPSELSFVKASCYSSRKIINKVTRSGARGVLCCGVDAPNVASWIAQELRMYHSLTTSQAKLGVNKYLQWEILHKASINVPKTVLLNEHSQWFDELSD